MATAVATLARGAVTTWAGTTRVLASERGVRQVWLPDWRAGVPANAVTGKPVVTIEAEAGGAAEAHLRQALTELAEFYGGTRREFTVALDPQGTSFYQRAWAEVARVQYGETRTYGEIARTIGAAKATRAVGAANGANPVAPFVPCHRIIGSEGRLHGYGPGLALKERLLVMEDAMPASPAEYPAWTERVAARRGRKPFYLGLRGVGVYCRPDCARPMRERGRPPRILSSPAEAAEAGFAPCPTCRPDR